MISLKLLFQEEYWGSSGAGALVVAEDTGRLLLLLRSQEVNESGTWGIISGKIESEETPKSAVKQELMEETGYGGSYTVYPLYTYNDIQEEFTFYNFLCLVPKEFEPQLNWENDNFVWAGWDEWPKPLHFDAEKLLSHDGNKIKKVIDLIRKKMHTIAEMDTPPAIVQPSSVPKPNGVLDQNSITNSYIIAATLWGESRGEGEKGMQAVLNVIMNRAKGNFSDAGKIVLKPKQFSMWNGVSNPAKKATELASKERNNLTYKTIINLIDDAHRGKLTDITGGATFYYNPKKVTPEWAKQMVQTKIIGNHIFLKSHKK